MLSAVELATLIAVCVPWADARLAGALIHAGSQGRPTLLIDETGRESEPTIGEAMRRLRETTKTDDSNDRIRFIGLVQMPHRALANSDVPIELTVNQCVNLQFGYTMWLEAYQRAGQWRAEPWQRLATAFNLFRTGKPELETEYSKQALDYVRNQVLTEPARVGEPQHLAAILAWASGQAAWHRVRIDRATYRIGSRSLAKAP